MEPINLLSKVSLSIYEKRKYLLSFDYLIPALIVLLCTFQPYLFNGIIDYWETGVYLPAINELFHHKILFRDVMITRGPLEIYIPAFFMSLFGRHINVLTACLYYGNVLAILFMVYIARALLKRRIFLYLLIPVLIAYSFPFVYSKIWGGLRFACGGAAILCALIYFRRRKAMFLLLSGLFTALGFFFSIEMGLFPFLAVSITLLVFKEKESFLRAIFFYLTGIIAIVLPFLLYIFFTGSMWSYFQNIISVPVSASAAYHFEILFPDMPGNPLAALKCLIQPFTTNFPYSFPLLIYLGLGIYLFNLFLKYKNNERIKQLFCIGLFGLLMYFGSFRQINGPQFQAASQPALVSLFVILETMVVSLRGNQLSGKLNVRSFILGSILFLFIFLLSFLSIFTVKNYMVYGFNIDRVIHRQINRGSFPTSNYAGMLNIKTAQGLLVPDWQAGEINSLVTYIQKNTSPDEIIPAFPDRGVFNFFFDRPCLGRFCQADIASFREDWMKEFFSRLKESKPRYIVYKREIDCFEPLISDYPVVRNRDRIRSFIKNNYSIETSFVNFDVYKIKENDGKENNRKH